MQIHTLPENTGIVWCDTVNRLSHSRPVERTLLRSELSCQEVSWSRTSTAGPVPLFSPGHTQCTANVYRQCCGVTGYSWGHQAVDIIRVACDSRITCHSSSSCSGNAAQPMESTLLCGRRLALPRLLARSILNMQRHPATDPGFRLATTSYTSTCHSRGWSRATQRQPTSQTMAPIHRDLNKMATILQTTYWHPFLKRKILVIYQISPKFLEIQMTIMKHWLRTNPVIINGPMVA